jgi:hypothetical protein
MIVSYNGTELTSNAILRWAQDRGMAWRGVAWRGNKSQPASRSKTVLAKASTAVCAMNTYT